MGGGRRAKAPAWEFVGWKPRRKEFIEYQTKLSIGVTLAVSASDPNDSLPVEM